MIGIETLDEFIIRKQDELPYAKGELSRLLRDIGLAAKIVNREVNKAGLVDILGTTGAINVQGEEVKKLDVYANKRFIAALKLGGKCILEDFLQKGSQQAAAGYIVYGSSTMLVYTTGHGVNGFTLDPSIGEFCLSHPNMQIPKAGKIYSINQGNFISFPEGVKEYIRYCKQEDKTTNRPYSLRYIGSMVADIHRNLISGGIFIYPATKAAPRGKLRLLYECNPMSFIVEQAGGRATDGFKRILDIEPKELHQRTPIFIGSEEMILKAEEFMSDYPSA